MSAVVLAIISAGGADGPHKWGRGGRLERPPRPFSTLICPLRTRQLKVSSSAEN